MKRINRIKACLVTAILFSATLCLGQLSHPNGYFTMYPYSSSYDDGSHAKIFYDGNNKRIQFWNSDANTQYTSLFTGTIESDGSLKGNLQHTSGYLYIKPYSSSYDDGTETRLYYNGHNKQILLVNSDPNTTYSGIQVGHVYSEGRIGIGTTSPSAELDVHGDIYIQRGGEINFTASGLKRAAIRATNSSPYNELQFFTGEYAEALRIDAGGKVGIGTTNPDEKLTVKGNIHAEEIKVDLSVPGPDYVFEPEYDLPTLEEIEQFIQAEKHLPEIPSAKEMEAEGVELGEMNMLLLKKIEELTLHIIRQEKRALKHQEKIRRLEVQIARLETEGIQKDEK